MSRSFRATLAGLAMGFGFGVALGAALSRYVAETTISSTLALPVFLLALFAWLHYGTRRHRWPVSREEALQAAQRAAELDDQEGFGELTVEREEQKDG